MTIESDKNQSSGDDLSGNSLTEAVSQRDSISFEEISHRIKQEEKAFGASLCVVVLLYLAAILFAGIIICRYAKTGGSTDWHVSLLAGAFIIPPTVILISLIGAAYHRNENISIGKLPSIKLLKELLIIVKDTTTNK
jgi:hypothetical protein